MLQSVKLETEYDFITITKADKDLLKIDLEDIRTKVRYDFYLDKNEMEHFIKSLEGMMKISEE
jgi:hypothetical protein